MKRLWIVVLLTMACSTAGEITAEDTAQPQEDAVVADEFAPLPDVAYVPDQKDIAALPDLAPIEELLPDFKAPDNAEPPCEPGTGCFLDHCESSEDCLSSWCVGHMGEDVCTVLCESECPQGWACKQVPGADVVFICVSNHANLCLPCESGVDCKGAAVDDVCVDYEDEGSFCGGACLTDEDCPWGFSCQDTQTVAGVETRQCVADAGVCPCTEKSVALGLYTPCSTENEFGACMGKRVCTADGLSDCDALAPALELCDGLDNDCDDDVDEPLEEAGNYINLCHDDNPCTNDLCNGAAGCEYQQLNEGECVDGDACTVGDHCEDGQCVGLPIVCDDGNPCTDNDCDGLGGCTATFNQAPCDDEDPCTVADTCLEGQCAGYAVECQCQQDQDCAALEDGNLCNGTLFCDQDQLPYQCAVMAETVVVCPASEDDICSKTICLEDTGQCQIAADHEGFACDDSDACTVGDVCTQGQCAPGVPLGCNDGNLCTDDSCNPDAGCQFTANQADCSDGDVCTLGDMCQDGDCVPGTGAPDCDDGNPCTDDGCDAALGCAHTPNDAQCDDGNDCSSGDHCSNGLCVPTEMIDCDDSNPCTSEYCTPEGGCVYTIIAAPCDDNDPCTVNDVCINGECSSGPLIECNDNNSCTQDSCAPEGGCINEPVEGACDDGNECTLEDTCLEGVCSGAELLDCDDDIVCTTDSCDPTIGCVHKLNTAPCDDQDLCTTGDHCHLGDCIGAGQLPCSDSNPCTDDSCQAAVGCQFLPNDSDCDDGNECTQNDGCSEGVCAPGEPSNCDDENPCTDDLCDYVQGCMHFANSLPCNDLDACTANEFCADEVCGGGVPIICEDSNLCTDDGCDPAVGCTFEANSNPCTDESFCTDGDQCVDKECVPGPELVCDDSSVCTTDSCVPETGCLFTPVEDETPCGVDLHCVAGACVDICTLVPGTKTFAMSKSVEQWAVPECVESITVEAWGAQGGKNNPCSQQGGKGAYIKGVFEVSEGENLMIIVGERGKDRGSDTANQSGTGGGGSFVWRVQGTELMVAAGGGGGGAICTSGGSPNHATGKDGVTGNCGTKDSTNGNSGGCDGANGTCCGCEGKGWSAIQNNPSGTGGGGDAGGYGGGGTIGSSHGGGGGGGYGGGGCKPYTGHPAAAGGGGGSYNGGTDTSGSNGAKTGHGSVTITW